MIHVITDSVTGDTFVTELSEDEYRALIPAHLSTHESIMSAIVAATQDRLDSWARSRNYDGILSACTYATSTIPRFSAEGQAAVNARDLTWATLYALLADVQAGTIPAPQSYVDIEPHLPELSWP